MVTLALGLARHEQSWSRLVLLQYRGLRVRGRVARVLRVAVCVPAQLHLLSLRVRTEFGRLGRHRHVERGLLSISLLLGDYLVELLVQGLQDLLRQLPAHFLDLDLVGSELELFFLQLAIEAIKLVLERLHLILLLHQLGLQSLFLDRFILLGLVKTLLQPLKVCLRVKRPIWVHVSLLRVGMHLLSSLLLLLFDKESHFTALVLKHDQLLVLVLHCFLILTLLELQLSELFFGNTKLLAQFTDLLIIVTMALKLVQCSLLLPLHF